MNETLQETPTYDVEVVPQSQAVDKPKPLAVAPRTATDMRVVEVSEALAPAYAKASTLELTDEEVAALTAPFPDSSVDIRPHDGLIFLSHINISDRLTKVFKPGKWSLVLRRHWLEQNIVYGEYILLIKGCYVGESIGGHPYQPNNPKVNYSDTLESTAAEALRRICGKRLSCGSQVWHKDYATKWVKDHAYQANGKWLKNDYAPSQPTPRATTVQNAPPASTVPVSSVPKPQPAPLTTEQRKARLITALEPLRPEALKVLVEEGVLMEGEDLVDISLTTIERMSPNQMLALIQTVKQRRADSDQVPGAEVNPETGEVVLTPQSTNFGLLTAVTVKEGVKNNKKWSKYGFKIGDNWLNSFDKKLHDAALALKGQAVGYTWEETDFGADLLTIEAAGEVVP